MQLEWTLYFVVRQVSSRQPVKAGLTLPLSQHSVAGTTPWQQMISGRLSKVDSSAATGEKLKTRGHGHLPHLHVP